MWGFPFNISATAESATSNLVHSLGLPRPIIKLHPEEKLWVVSGSPVDLTLDMSLCSPVTSHSLLGTP